MCALGQELPWHAAGWAQRAVVSVTDSAGQGIDVGAVRILHCGSAQPTANDYRVFDSSGQPVPYQVTFHDPARDTLISFKASPGASYAIYFGKADAPVDPMRTIVDPAPGKGAPQPGPSAGGWVPRAGLVLATYRRPREMANPETADELAKMLAASTDPDGADYHLNISDGVNPHGDSDYYVSVYRGWLRIPSSGTYGFCTASNEASFSFLDGKELVHWPGRHTEERGKRGEKHAEHALQAGLRYVEYYHEEVVLYGMAFLGYKPPGGGHYVGIPNDLFVQPHRAVVQRYETADGKRSVVPKIELLDSRWPPGRKDGQHTRFRFAVDAGATTLDLGGWTVRWSFGDGQTATGSTVEHLFLTTGPHQVTMTATGPAGEKVERAWPVKVFRIDHVVGSFKQGQLKPYAEMAKQYDAGKLPTPALAELARLMNEAGERDAAKQHAQAAIARGDASADDLADMHLLVATASALGKSGVSGSSLTPEQAKEVAGHLRAAIEKESDPVERMRMTARFIRTVGIDQADLPTAEQLYVQAQEAAKTAGLKRPMRVAFREATIAIGDAHLFAKQIDKASLDYKTAEALDDPPIPPQVRASKGGAFPEAIEQRLESNDPEGAMAVVRRWQDEVPSDQIRGAVLYYAGKIERLQGRPAGAIRPLQLAIELAQGAEFEAEARYLLAQAYGDTGDGEARTRTLNGLVKSGLSGPYREKAIEELKSAAATPGGAK